MHVTFKPQRLRYGFTPFLLVVGLLGTPMAWGTDSDVVVEGLAIAETLKKLRDEVCLNASSIGRELPPFCEDASSKYVFITSTTSDGNFGGIAGADAICNQLAAAGGLPGFYRAWLSTSTEDAKDRIDDSKYVRTDDVVVATSKADLLDSSIDNPIDKDEIGESVPPPTVPASFPFDVWTGTLSAGTASSSTCSEWTNAGALGSGGSSNDTTGLWTSKNADICANPRRLYCFGIDDPPLLAVAYINDDGIDGYSEQDDTLIAGLYDFNGDGVVSVGDRVRHDQYPLDFDAVGRGTFGGKTSFVTAVVSVLSSQVFVRTECGAPDCRSVWQKLFGGPLSHENYTEWSNLGQHVHIEDRPSDGFPDKILAQDFGVGSLPQATVFPALELLNQTDDAFIDVDINP